MNLKPFSQQHPQGDAAKIAKEPQMNTNRENKNMERFLIPSHLNPLLSEERK